MEDGIPPWQMPTFESTVTNKIKPIISTYTIHDTLLSVTDSAKYLGVVIDSKLQWKTQYTDTIKKCNSTLAFLKRNLSRAPEFVKKKCYTTLVRPKLEYASAIWDPHCNKYIELIEKVKKRADSLPITTKWNLVIP